MKTRCTWLPSEDTRRRGYQARNASLCKEEGEGRYMLLRKSAHVNDEDLSSKTAKSTTLSYRPIASHLSVL